MKTNLIDIYLRRPILLDLVFSVCLYFAVSALFLKFQFSFDKPAYINVISNIIGTTVSLAGFILAALTIIVTFKSNLSIKGITQAENALELIFSTQHYYRILSVFKGAILEFVFLFIGLYTVWQFSNNIEEGQMFFVSICSILLTAFITLRSLAVLFKILSLEKHNLDKKRS